MTALEAGLEAVLFAAGDAVTIERLSAATFVMAKNWLLFSMNQVQEPALALNPLC